VVKHVENGSPAQKAGIQVNDEVVKLSGRPVSTWREVEETLALGSRQDIAVEVLRGGQPEALTIRPMPLTKEHERYDIGDTGLSPYLAPIIGSLVAGYPGQKAGLKVGDKIVAVSGQPVTDYWEVVRRIREISATFPPDAPRTIDLVVERDGKQLPFSITPRREDGWKIGFTPRYDWVSRRLSLGEAMQASLQENVRMAKTTFGIVGRLFSGRGSMRQLSGPIDIAKFSGEAARSGASELLSLMAMLSLQLGILNLLPIPLLDGGQIAVTLLETIARRDFSLKVKERLLQLGFVFLVLVMVVVLALDVLKNFGL
jgi:regulator of sigma E protease